MKRSPLLSLVVYVIAIFTFELAWGGGLYILLIRKPVNPFGEVFSSVISHPTVLHGPVHPRYLSLFIAIAVLILDVTWI